LGFFCNFIKSIQSQHTPIGRKFTQSGHPGMGVCTYLFTYLCKINY
jgi:hypothetical protein